MSVKPISSLDANARSVIAVRNTAESTMTRTLHNEGLSAVLPVMVARMCLRAGLVTPDSFVNCDHSDFDGLVAFVCAVQTCKGRAVPIYVGTSYSGKLPAHPEAPPRKRKLRSAYNQRELNLYEQTVVDLEALAAHLGFWPKLVFDRGFSGGPLVHALVEYGATFYIRMKADRLVAICGQPLKASELTGNDCVVELDGMRLRVVRSETPASGEPWYILTSDMTSSRDEIIKVYYYRFEIEESFRGITEMRKYYVIDSGLTKPMIPWLGGEDSTLTVRLHAGIPGLEARN